MNCVNHPDREKIAFCQNCGKPLCAECSRIVGAAVFCEPCLEARLWGAAPGGAAPGAMPGFTAVPPPVMPPPIAGGPASFGYQPINPMTGLPVSRGFAAHEANPWLAAGLGFIPGVGAMYNEQYAKGVVHLAVFAVLVSLSDAHDFFGIFVAGWIFYMAIEAYHTARARRDGLPLPNPFGLNDIGERLGFGRSWGTTGAVPSAVPGATPASSVPQQDPAPPAYSAVPYPAPGVATPASSWTYVSPDYSAHYAASGTAAPPVQPGAPIPGAPIPGAPMPGLLDVGIPHPGSRFGARFPIGAIWLIGLGVIFLLGSSGLFHGRFWFSGRLFVPLLLVGVAVWTFFNRMTRGGRSLSDDGFGDYKYRLISAVQGSAFIGLTGALFFLNDFDIISWGHSWPLYIILAGVLAILKRTILPPPLPLYPYAVGGAASAVPPVYSSQFRTTHAPSAAERVAQPTAESAGVPSVQGEFNQRDTTAEHPGTPAEHEDGQHHTDFNQEGR